MKTSPFQKLPNSAFKVILPHFISHYIRETADKGCQCSDCPFTIILGSSK